MKRALRRAQGPDELDIYVTALRRWGGWTPMPAKYRLAPVMDGVTLDYR